MTDFNQKTHDTDVGSHGGLSRQMMEVFENQEFGSIRVLQEACKTFFCASDVAKALGYVNPYAAVKRHCRGPLTKREGVVQKVHQSGISILTLKRRIKLDTCRCRAVHWITHCILSGSSSNHFPRNGSVWGQKIATDTMQAGVAGNLWRKIYWTKKWYAAVQAVRETNSQRIVWNESHDTLSVFVLDDFGNRLESSNNHVTRWETNGVFFCLNPAV